uniref:Rho-GAP domain-containing protein n=1 Tax=Leptobrachium leishanense TaxID=445787 RepID=A0A8C5R825_9ANUR
MSLAIKARQKGKKKGGKDKVFGCDLVEHLQVSGLEVPLVLKSCTEFVEEHGIVDGIYRLCGIASNVQKLRQEFETERLPDLNKDTYLQDVHCVSSLCKAYFRQLPNPLLTYQLYDKFADAVAIQLEQERLVKIKDVLKDLPLPHYRTLEYLMKHLVKMASFSSQTNMHARNLAIVWAPNLLRSKDIEASGFNGTAAFMEVRIQSIVVEFILTHVEQLFGNVPLAGNGHEANAAMPEDYLRSLSYNVPSMLNQGDGPPQIRPYHTIIEISDQKRKGSVKAKKWKSIFNLGRSNNDSKRKKQDDKDERTEKMNLRPAKSMDSLSSLPFTADGLDLDRSRLVIARSPKTLIPIRRESFESHSKQVSSCPVLDAELQDVQLEIMQHNLEYEEEPLAKSEPTTPKTGRSSAVGIPQGRSPKGNQNRAEKCVGVHISGPFSVTLPFHITSNLSRLTRGMECPSLIYPPLSSSEKSSSREESQFVTNHDVIQGNSSLVCENDKHPPNDTKAKLDLTENDDSSLEVQKLLESLELNVHNEPLSQEKENVQDKNSPMTENDEISLDVQDTFSFLDSQDVNTDLNVSDSVKAEEDASLDEKMTGYPASCFPVDNDILEDEMGNVYMSDNAHVEEFSVEPPPDDLPSEDEDQMYFIASGCYDIEDHSKEIEDAEEIFHSAYDDLSPLCSVVGTPFIAFTNDQPDTSGNSPGLEKVNILELKEELLETESAVEPVLGQEEDQTSNSKKSVGEIVDEGFKATSSTGNGYQSKGVDNYIIPQVSEDSETRIILVIKSEEEDPKENSLAINLGKCPFFDGEEMLQHHLDPEDPALPDELHSLEIQTILHETQRENQDELQFHISLDDDSSNSHNIMDIPDALDEPKDDEMQYTEHIQLVRSDASVKQNTAMGYEPIKDLQLCYEPEYKETTTSASSETEGACKLVNGMYPDGSASMTLATSLPKIQQVKSVPVVPPKPQYAMLPPALRSKIQVGSLSTNKDGRHHVTDTSDSSVTTELIGDSPKKQRYSKWKSGGSISFDTAVALAKDRQLSMCPVRRMQTYCIGDTCEIKDTAMVEGAPSQKKQDPKLDGSSTNRPHSCLVPLKCTDEASKEASHSNDMPTSPGGMYRSQNLLSPDCWPSTHSHSNRNRMSLPRVGKQSSIEEPPDSYQLQRRSLL